MSGSDRHLVPAVVLGGQANALSVARRLGARGIPVHVFADGDAPARFTRYRAAFVAVAPGPDDRYLEPLRTHGPGAGVIIPCGDDGLRFVATHRSELETMGYLPVEADDDVLLAMLDKEHAYELARRCDVPTPRTVTIADADDMRAAARELGLPAAVKPRVSHAFARVFAGKAIVVHDVDSAVEAFEQLRSHGLEAVLTEIIPGPEGSYFGYYAYIAPDGTRLWDFTKRKLRQFPLGFGLGTLHRMEHNQSVIEVGRRFVEGVGHRGLVNAEFKHDGRDGRFVFIECNHRITAADRLMVADGIDLAGFVYDRLTGRPTHPVAPLGRKVALWWPLRDTLAALGMLRTGDLTIRAWLASLGGRLLLPVARWDDPMPAIAGIVGFARRLPRRLARLAQARR